MKSSIFTVYIIVDKNNLHFQHTFTCRELVYIITIATVELYSTT